MNIIETLGKIKCAEALPNLLDMLKNKSATDKGEQLAFQEKICNALGAIGSPDAVSALSDIAERIAGLKPDAVFLAGDIYDHPTPGADAVALLDRPALGPVLGRVNWKTPGGQR